MKKNWTLRVGVLMLALTLITSCFVGGTFAKYVTSGSGTDTARVAKFGVTVTGTGSAFSTTYAKDDATLLLEVNTVVSSNDDKLVAPGTSGNMAAFTATGTPEVAVRVTYEATTFSLTNWTTNEADEYCPLVFTVAGTDYKIDGTITTVAALETAVKAAISNYTKDYVANTDLSAQGADALAISWEWPFYTSAANDVKDTALGDRAAAVLADAGKVEMAITATITQID